MKSNEHKIEIAKRYCEAIYEEHGMVTKELFIEYDKTHGKQLLTWDEANAANRCRLHEAMEWIANVALENQGKRGERAYINTIKITKGVPTRGYFPIEDVVADSQMYQSAKELFLDQLIGVIKKHRYLEEARILEKFIEEGGLIVRELA